MAIRKRGNSYQVYWNNPFTGRRECSTEPDERAAKKKDALIKYQLEFERETFRRPEEENLRQPTNTLNAVTMQMLRERAMQKSSLKSKLESLKTLLTMLGDMPIKDITSDHLIKVRDTELAKGIRTTSLATRFGHIMSIFHWAEQEGIIEKAPKKPRLPEAHYRKFIPPTEDEVKAILAVASDLIRRVVIIGTQFGVRVGPSEMLKLEWSDFDFRAKVVRVRAASKNKSEPWRAIPIRAELLPILNEWKAKDDKIGTPYLFHRKGKQVLHIRYSWYKTLEEAGITRKIRPYDLRHAFATEAIAGGADIGTVARLMGHSNINMIIKHYQHVMDKQKIAAVESLPHVPLAMCHINSEVIQ